MGFALFLVLLLSFALALASRYALHERRQRRGMQSLLHRVVRIEKHDQGR